jgi:FkbM family methyltransferase
MPVTAFIDVPARVADREFRLTLPGVSSDPVVAAYAAGEQLNSYLTDLLLQFAPERTTVLDLGCHVGTFSVAAAALGYRVVAVDASPLHVEVVRRSAEQNDLPGLTVIHAAVTDRAQVVRFNPDGLFGSVVDGEAANDPTASIEVGGDTVAALLDRVGVKLEEITFIKADVEGSELAALAGMAEFLAGSFSPPIVYESNPLTSRPKGFSVDGLRTALEVLGYRTYRKEGEDLFVCPPSEPQPEAWVDLMALKDRHLVAAGLVSSGRWPSESFVDRIAAWGGLEHANVRTYVAEVLLSSWSVLPADPRLADLASVLAEDEEPEVRAAIAPLVKQLRPLPATAAGTSTTREI